MNEQKKEDIKSNKNITDREKRVEEARKFNLLSNTFMSVALKDKKACQYVLRILTGIKGLTVKEVRGEYRISKMESHDAILDILAEDETGRLYNMEIQRADTVDHARRTRFYASMIDSEYLEKGKTYGEIPDVYIIYISETDLWKAGYTTYPIKKFFGDTGIEYDDGQHILYVNAAVDDGSETAKLMQYFKTADPDDMRYGDLSKRVHDLKRKEGGYAEMYDVAEKIFKEGMEQGIEQGIEQGREQGIEQGKVLIIRNMLQSGLSDEDIKKYAKATEQEIAQAKESE